MSKMPVTATLCGLSAWQPVPALRASTGLRLRAPSGLFAIAEKTVSLLENYCWFRFLCSRKWKVLQNIWEPIQWNRKTHTRRSKQYSSRGNNKDFLPFVSMQDLSSLLEHVPAQSAVCYTTYMILFYLQKVYILLPLGNSFCFNTYLQITKNIASAIKTMNCCNNSKLYLWLHWRLINPKFMPQQRFHFHWKK